MFLYFLQRKGWLGAKKGESISTGDKNFLRSLFNKSVENKANFYNDYLEKLFYGALNKPAEKAGSYYRSYFDCQIPFLNGGLFEPPQNYDWEGEFLLLPDKLFSKDPKNPSHGDGILDIFDLYNFTVDESDFLDKEVSVDPEMLGKVFENLLEENLRKGKGTYYTPREIVNYMCEESVVNYLATETGLAFEDVKNKYFPAYNVLGDEKFEDRDVSVSEQIIKSLKNIKIVDPACGSGAFLVGMLQQITHLRYDLEGRSKLLGRRGTTSSEYEIKKQTIQNCIYGVDIDPGAVDIAKLRLWLSLVVDYDLEEIEPLPNLDYKIMQGNSLLEELVLGDTTVKLYDQQIIQKALGSKKMKTLFEQESQVSLFDGENDKVLKTMRALQLKYFSTSDSESKKKIRDQIDKIEHDLIDVSIRAETEQLSAQRLNIRTIPGIGLLPNDAKRLMNISSKESQIMTVLDELKKTGTKPFFLWHLHFTDVFEEKGGFDVVIANPPYVRADTKDPNYQTFRRALEKTGRFISLYEKWDLFIPFIEWGLVLANDKGFLSYIVSNAVCTSKYAFKLLDLIQEKYYLRSIDYFEDMQVFDAGVVPVVIMISKTKSFKETHKLIRNAKFENIGKEQNIEIDGFKKLGRNGFKKDYSELLVDVPSIRLGDICYISKGMVLNSDENSDKGGFAKDDLISSIKTELNSKPYIEGKYLKKYLIEKRLFLEWNTDRVPGKLSRATFPEMYEIPKIMRGRVTDGTYDDTGLVCNDSIILYVRFCNLSNIDNKSISGSIKKFNSLTRAEVEKISQRFDLKYLLAIINSRFANFYLNNNRRHRLENYFYPDDFRNLPIADISEQQQKAYVDLVNTILEITKAEDFTQNRVKQSNVHKYEIQIDQLVYKLYDLSPEEIRVVEHI